MTINKITMVASRVEKVAGKLFRFVEDTAVPITGTATLMDIFAHQARTASQYPSAAGPGTVAF